MTFADLYRWWQGDSGPEHSSGGSQVTEPNPRSGITATLPAYFDGINAGTTAWPGPSSPRRSVSQPVRRVCSGGIHHHDAFGAEYVALIQLHARRAGHPRPALANAVKGLITFAPIEAQYRPWSFGPRRSSQGRLHVAGDARRVRPGVRTYQQPALRLRLLRRTPQFGGAGERR